MSNHEVWTHLLELLHRSESAFDPGTSDNAILGALLAEMDRRERRGRWRSCTCERCFQRFMDPVDE